MLAMALTLAWFSGEMLFSCSCAFAILSADILLMISPHNDFELCIFQSRNTGGIIRQGLRSSAAPLQPTMVRCGAEASAGRVVRHLTSLSDPFPQITA